MPVAVTTHIADGMANPKTKRTGFLDLPAELRIDIYRYTFNFAKPIRCHATIMNGKFFEVRSHFNISSQLLRTCKTVYNEARPVLFQMNTFQISGSLDLRCLKKATRGGSRLVQTLSFENSYLGMNQTRCRELRPLVSLKHITLCRYGANVARKLRCWTAQDRDAEYTVNRETQLADFMLRRPDIHYEFCEDFAGPVSRAVFARVLS